MSPQTNVKYREEHDIEDHHDEASDNDTVDNENTPLIISSANQFQYNNNHHSLSSPMCFSPSNNSDNTSKIKKRRKKSLEIIPSSNVMELAYDELQHMLNLSIPVIGTYLLEMLPGIVSIVLVGHMQTEESKEVEEYIDATSQAVMFLNTMALATGFGLASAMDTLCSQAYGADETHRIGTYLQTGFIVLSALFSIVLVVCYYCTDILIALGQPIHVSELAGVFLMYLLPGIPFLYVFELLRKVLQSQNIALPMLYASIVANILNASFGYYFVYYTSWGYLGAAIARTIAHISFVVFIVPYMMTSGLMSTFWSGLQLKQAMKGIDQFLNLGFSGMLQLCFEWWAFEILSVICGLLPNAVPAIGSNSVLLNITSMAYMFYLGNSISGNVRVGNALGANLPNRASVAATITLLCAAVTSIFCAAILLIFRTQLPYLFTHDEEINYLVQNLMVLSAMFQVADASNAAIQGIFRGSGRQSLGAKLNFVAYYVVGMPLGAIFAFGMHYNLFGLWVGMTIGLFIIAIFGTIIIYQSDWKSLAEEARERLHRTDEIENNEISPSLCVQQKDDSI